MAKEEKTKDRVVLKSDLRELGALMKSDITSQVKKDIQRSETELRQEIKKVETELQGEIKKVETGLRQEIKKLETDLQGEIRTAKKELKNDINRIESVQDKVLIKLIEHDADIADIKERLKKLDYFDDLMRGQDLMIGLLKKMLEEMAAFSAWSLRTEQRVTSHDIMFVKMKKYIGFQEV